MKNLIEIAKIVTKKKVKKIEIFDEHSLKHRNSKFNEFYEALLAGKFKNDRDAASVLYGCSPTDDKYRQLKSRFKKRLLNTLFFLDVNLPATSNYERAYFSCNRDWSLVNILRTNKADLTAVTLAKSILTTSLKFRFSDMIVNSARLLREYAADQGDEKAYYQYNEYIDQYQEVVNAEIRSEEVFQKVKLLYAEEFYLLPDIDEKLKEYCDNLVSISEIYESPKIFFNMYLVWAFRYEMQGNFDAMLEVCEKAEEYMENHPGYYQSEKLALFQLKKMSGYLHLRDFKKGKVNAEKCLQSFPAGSNTWFKFMEYYFLLSVHTENYVQALAIFNNASTQSKYKRLAGGQKQKWKLFEVYINYLAEAYADQMPVLRTLRRKSFRVSRFLDEPVKYSRDQKILGVHAVIAQVLFQINRNNQNLLVENIDRLKTIANRQLKKETNSRMILFIRLLQQLAKADFKTSNLSNTQKYQDAMKEKPFYYRGFYHELEIIPFEKLWTIIILKM